MPFKKRPVYYYDSETCTYHKEVLTVSQRLGKASSYFILTAIFSIGALLAYEFYFHQFKEQKLASENSLLIEELAGLNEKMDEFDTVLETIHERESGLYASIMESEAISSQVWKGGRGGTDRYDLRDSELPERMGVRLELLKYRLTKLKGSLTKVQSQATKKTEQLRTLPALRPVNVMESTFISGFGMRIHPVTGHGHFHAGLDFACPSGTPIYATGNGEITFAGASGHGYGNYVDINHGNGFLTKYAHMSKVIVEVGQNVKRGDLIGYSGNTGLSTGPHLHYEIERNGEKVNPLDFFYDISPIEYLEKKNQKAPSISMD